MEIVGLLYARTAVREGPEVGEELEHHLSAVDIDGLSG
jgi:hypothetical protein